MSSKKDKDYHFLRNPEKYMEGKYRPRGLKTEEDAEMEEKFNKIHSKYGFKSMVSDKRRRNSTRKSNQKTKKIEHQKIRAKLKQDTIKAINENDEENIED